MDNGRALNEQIGQYILNDLNTRGTTIMTTESPEIKNCSEQIIGKIKEISGNLVDPNVIVVPAHIFLSMP